MAFKRTLTKNVGTALTTVRSFIGPVSDTVIGLRVTNTGAVAIKVSACVTNGGIDYYLVGGPTPTADVPVGGSIVIINGDIDKVVMEAGDVLRVASNTASSCDVIASVLAQ